MVKELNIGEMAALNCVSTKTLRIYHDLGILTPKRIDPDTGYRYYDATQCFALDQIQQLQSMGATLSEIKAALNSKEEAALAKLVQERHKAIDDEIARLRLARHSAEEFMRDYDSYTSPPPTGKVAFEQMPIRYALMLPLEYEQAVPVSNEAGPNIEAWEFALHMAKKRMVDQGVPIELFHNLGWRMRQEDFEADNYRLESIVVFVGTPGLARQYNAYDLPSGTWASIHVSGYLGKDGANSEYGALQDLATTIEEKGLKVCGDCLKQVLFNTSTLFGNGRNALFKLQVPVCTA